VLPDGSFERSTQLGIRAGSGNPGTASTSAPDSRLPRPPCYTRARGMKLRIRGIIFESLNAQEIEKMMRAILGKSSNELRTKPYLYSYLF
jgi:hypothetical protein